MEDTPPEVVIYPTSEACIPCQGGHHRDCLQEWYDQQVVDHAQKSLRDLAREIFDLDSNLSDAVVDLLVQERVHTADPNFVLAADLGHKVCRCDYWEGHPPGPAKPLVTDPFAKNQ